MSYVFLTGWAFAAPAKPQAAIRVEPSALGNVFVVGEKVSIPVAAPGATLNWTITDFFHRSVASGQSPITDGKALIEPPVTAKGFYAVQIRAGEYAADTSFAIVAKHDIAKMPNSPFGVMTHFAQNWDTDILPLIAKAGISSIRDEQYWGQVEKDKGTFVFREQLQKYMAEAKQLGIEPLIALTFENKHYDKGLTPHTEEGYNGFGRYGQEVLKQYGQQIKAVEVWNEYNGTWCKGPAAKDRPKYYTELLKASYEHVKAVRPDVKVLGGAAVLLPPPYFEGIFQHGGLQYMDGVVIHPYRGQPEGIDEEIRELKALMRKYGGEKPIWVTETGRHDTVNPDGRYNVARYLARMYVLLLSEKCERVYWYLLRDYHNFKTMGLLHDVDAPQGRYAAAPPYAVYSNLIEQLYGAAFVKRETTQQPRTYIMRFDRGQEQVRACWSTVPAHLTLLTEKPVTVTDLVGGETTLTPVNGQVFLTLTDNVVYVKGSITGVKEAGGWFQIEPQQTIDLLDAARVRFHMAEPVNNVSFHVGEESATVSMQSRELARTGESTAEPREATWWYTLKHNGQAVGTGGVQIRIADPLVFEPAVLPSADGTAVVRLQNTSRHVAYDLQGPISVVVGNGLGGVNAPATLRPLEQLVIHVPMDGKVVLPIDVRVPLKGREAATFVRTIHVMPIAKATIRIDGDLTEWKDIQPLLLSSYSRNPIKTADVKLAWDEDHLYVATDGLTSPLRLSVASSAKPLETWQELRLPEVAIAKPVGGEVAIPWSTLRIDPKAGSFRLTLDTEGETPLHWGGRRHGRDPAAMPFILLDAPEADFDKLRAAVEPLPKVGPPKIGPVVADSSDDYTNVQGKGGWSYGYFDGSSKDPYGVADFKPMDYVQTIWGYEWAKEGIKYLKLTRDGGHPQAADGRPVWAVRRWTSPLDGRVRLSGRLANNRKGDGVGVHVLVDGVIHASYAVGGAKGPLSRDWDLIVAVKKGSTIDLAITPGPALDTTDDATIATMRVEKVE